MTELLVGARSSPLSLTQVDEILSHLHRYHPNVQFKLNAVKTLGDLDRHTSLRDLNKTDFFTKEIDMMLLSGECRIAIHSAKDLPDPLPKGLKIIALTVGIDSSDSLVLREGQQLRDLPPGAVIATSSTRREEAVKLLKDDLAFTDIRGTISERLSALEHGNVFGVVIAEAALIRLKLTHLNRVRLPGSTVPMQGQLAIVARADDQEMESLFAPLDSRKKMLYVGLELPHDMREFALHYPLIRIEPLKSWHKECCHQFEKATHIIFTSQSAIHLFFKEMRPDIKGKTWIAVGEKSAQTLRQKGIKEVLIAKEATAEGVIDLLQSMDLADAFVLWPHAARARSVITDYLNEACIPFCELSLYDTVPSKPAYEPPFDHIEEFYFTSPSTIEAYIQFFGAIPTDKVIHTIGPVTKKALNKH